MRPCPVLTWEFRFKLDPEDSRKYVLRVERYLNNINHQLLTCKIKRAIQTPIYLPVYLLCNEPKNHPAQIFHNCKNPHYRSSNTSTVHRQ
jgi:hypothetical protein